jgi:hypothetical protein
MTDDLEQVAAVGVIKAIDRFDLSRDVDVMSYVFLPSSASSSATSGTASGRCRFRAASRSSTTG